MNEALLKSAYASKMSYWKNMQRMHSQPNYVRLDKQLKNRAFIWKSGESSTIISFKGTISVKDVINFLDDKLESFTYVDKCAKIHRGVLKYFKDVENDLTKYILNEKIKYITFTGHSMGGALALFATAYYSKMFDGNIGIKCHIFGTPKIGDGDMVDWLTESENVEITDVRNIWDIVPLLPFLNKSYKNIESSYNQKILTIEYDNFLSPITAHDMDEYIKNLSNDIRLLQK